MSKTDEDVEDYDCLPTYLQAIIFRRMDRAQARNAIDQLGSMMQPARKLFERSLYNFMVTTYLWSTVVFSSARTLWSCGIVKL
jgi:hypothetical protein